MTSPLSFFSRLCFKPLKRMLYSCQCLLTCVCLIWVRFADEKKFSLLAWFFLTIHLSLPVSEVSYKPLTSHMTFSFFFNFFIYNFCMWNLSWLICQHWLLYNKLSSNNINNNNNVSVVQVWVSELTAHRALILYNAYVAVLTLVPVDVNSVLFIDQQQLIQYTHFSQTRVILVLLSVNVLFVRLHITSNQVRTHQSSYINAILIQSQNVLISVGCLNCQAHSMTLFLKCHHTSEHFNECCNNCKWQDHMCCCSACNNDVLIVILNDENNNNDVNESEPATQLRRITSALLSVRVVVIYVTS